MTNEQKYVTPEERVKAFKEFCKGENCDTCKLFNDCKASSFENFAHWLALPSEEEKPMPCPFCGGSVNTFATSINGMAVHGISCFCGYRKSMPKKIKIETVIAAHNRVARAVRAAKESEVKL